MIKEWMAELCSVLIKKKWSIGLISFMLLFNAPFLYFTNHLHWVKLIFVYAISVLSIGVYSTFCLFLKNRMEKLYLIFLFIISLVPNVIVFSYILISKTFMRGEMFWVIFDSNVNEASEFATNFTNYSILWGILSYIGVCLFLLYKSGSPARLPWKKYRLLVGIAVVALLFIVGTRSGAKGVGSIDFYKSAWLYYRSENREVAQAASRSEIKVDVKTLLPDTCNHTIVFIIGESQGRAHMELYGYFRPTNPLLTAMKEELYVYENVVCSETYTIPSLRNVLTFADSMHPEYEYQKASVVGLFKAAGFETYWITNQELKKEKIRGYDAVALEAQHVVSLHQRHEPDEVVFPELDKILAQDQIRNKIVFIHIMGCHTNYGARYPRSFSYFDYRKDPLPDKSFLEERQKIKVDEYDNAIRYNDYVVSTIVNRLKTKGRSSCAVYFSDHGEEVYDFRDFMGHELSNASSYQYEIPFLLWLSPSWEQELPEFTFDKGRPYSTEHFIHSLSFLARLRYPDYRPEFSIFSPEFQPQERRMRGFIYQDMNGQ